VKVCNGDYGDLKWRGINQAVLDKEGFITACAARMNDFYLANEQDDAKQYTMCHEVGHSFGLPHTDEDFDNPDLGNCMDYTNNFDVNKHPDATNYEFLLELYGPSGGRRLRQGNSFKSAVREMPETVRRKMKEAVSKLDQRRDDRAHEDGWRLLHRAKHGEAHELELGEGYKVQVQMLLA
jgi:predicted Zn-dependent protease with MMP-like domain